ncbi:MAG: hypothetical protein GX131_03655 [candidate division WS1 bacterium]|jgi:exopolysaccharide biosynthesis protein|nr:hypothetical protein [candidate division WS1 bacterium]
MTARTIAAIGLLAAAIVTIGMPAAHAAGDCVVVINGRPLETGQAVTGDAGELLLSAGALSESLGFTVDEPQEGAPWCIRAFGHTLLVRPRTASYTLDDLPRTAAVGPELRDGELFVPLAIVRTAIELFAVADHDGATGIWFLSTPGSGVTDIRDGRHEDRIRLVLDLARPTGFTWWNEPGLLVLELPTAEDSAWANSVRLLRLDGELADQIRQGPAVGNVTRIEVQHNSPLSPRVFTLPDPARIVIDLLREPSEIEPEPEPVVPLPRVAGLMETRNFTTPRGAVRVYVLNVDPRSSQIDVRPALAASTIHERATLTRIAAGSRAWGGVNGGFFSYNGPPLGMLVIDGEWIKEPWGERTALGITYDGRLLMDRVSFCGRAVFDGLGAQPITGLNQGHGETDTLVAFTRRWGPMVEGAVGRTRVAVDAAGVVLEKTTNGRVVSIPEGGFVLSGIGRMAESLKLVEPGVTVKLELGTTPAWPNLRHAIGGGPRLVKDGRKHITASPERFRPDVCVGTPSRTAIGITAEGRLLLVVAEGVGEGRRCGMTLDELAGTMIKLGAVQAMNLDGGGSSTFVADGRLINAPSDGVQRRVSNALLVFTQAERTAAGGQ